MPRGGSRVGAGRKPNGTNRRTSKSNEIAEKAAGKGPLPLQILLEVMRAYYAAGEYAKAAAVARDAAPYEHPRKAAITVEGGDNPIRIEMARADNFYANLDRLSAAGNGASDADSPS